MSTLSEIFNRAKKQNFRDSDSQIVSAIMNPKKGIRKIGSYLQDQISIAAGLPQNTDESSMYAYSPSMEQQAGAANNLAGIMQTGAIPFAPRSSGGTLGTFIGQRAKGLDSEAANNASNLSDIPLNDLINRYDTGKSSSIGFPQTEFSKAHKIAQANAALPIEQGGLGLLPDNTAMDRAKAMGFNMDKQLYHGTKDALENGSFMNEYLGKTTYSQSSKKAHFFSDSPKSAEHYANISRPLWMRRDHDKLSNLLISTADEKSKLYNYLKDKGVIESQGFLKPIKLSETASDNDKGLFEKYNTLREKENEISGKLKKIRNISLLEAETEGNVIYPVRLKSDNILIKDFKGERIKPETYSDILNEAALLGKDGARILNTHDPLPDNITAIFKPNHIRSTNAAFDPFKKYSSNILASILAGTTLATTYQDKKGKK